MNFPKHKIEDNNFIVWAYENRWHSEDENGSYERGRWRKTMKCRCFESNGRWTGRQRLLLSKRVSYSTHQLAYLATHFNLPKNSNVRFVTFLNGTILSRLKKIFKISSWKLILPRILTGGGSINRQSEKRTSKPLNTSKPIGVDGYENGLEKLVRKTGENFTKIKSRFIY